MPFACLAAIVWYDARIGLGRIILMVGIALADFRTGVRACLDGTTSVDSFVWLEFNSRLDQSFYDLLHCVVLFFLMEQLFAPERDSWFG